MRHYNRQSVLTNGSFSFDQILWKHNVPTSLKTLFLSVGPGSGDRFVKKIFQLEPSVFIIKIINDTFVAVLYLMNPEA